LSIIAEKHYDVANSRRHFRRRNTLAGLIPHARRVASWELRMTARRVVTVQRK